MLWAEAIKVFFSRQPKSCRDSGWRWSRESGRWTAAATGREELDLKRANKCVTDMSTCLVSWNDNNDDYDRISGGKFHRTITLSSRSCRSCPSWKPTKESSLVKWTLTWPFLLLVAAEIPLARSHTHARLPARHQQNLRAHILRLCIRPASKRWKLPERFDPVRAFITDMSDSSSAKASSKCAVKRLSFSLAADSKKRVLFSLLDGHVRLKGTKRDFFFILKVEGERASYKKYSPRGDSRVARGNGTFMAKKSFNRISNLTETRSFMDKRIVLCI